jgi:hypothetical protein
MIQSYEMVMLKQLLVIPRTPSPASLEEILVEDLNIGELRELTRHRKVQAGATSIGIKKERVGPIYVLVE